MEMNFQLLLLSPNLLKSKVPILEGGVRGNQFPTFVTESKFAKIQSFHFHMGGGTHGNQFPTFVTEYKFAKIQSSHFFWGGGAHGNHFATFVAESKFAKIQSSHFWGGGGGWWNQFPTFDAESKFTLKKKKKKNFAKNFLSFRAKMCLGMVLDFEYQVVRIYEVYANHKNLKEEFLK